MKPSTVLSRHIVPTFKAASRYGKAGLLAILGTCSWMALTAHRGDADPSPFNAWFRDVQQHHARVWSGKFDPDLYVRERAQLNTLSELMADLEADTTAGGAQDIRAALRALRADTH
jgi:hypothetical protein